MEKITRTSELEVHDVASLSDDYKSLVEDAKRALESSYSPYSNFPVGAAVLLSDGKVMLGSNQENAAYPSGLCAERTALFAVGAQFPGKEVKAIAVTFGQKIDEYPIPCGSCLQVISEFQSKQSQPLDVLMLHPASGKVLLSKGLHNLLPFAFDKSFLGK